MEFVPAEKQDLISSSYTLITSQDSEYLEDYPLLQDEELYILSDITKEDRTTLDDIMYLPLVILYNLNNSTFDISMIPDTNINYNEVLEQLDKSLTDNQVIAYLKNEYEIIGLDTDKIQMDYRDEKIVIEKMTEENKD